jgi:hypothetical protein
MHSILRCVGLSALALATSGFGTLQTPPRATIKDVGWIEGTWTSTSGARTVEERWTSGAGGTMFAVARTLDGERLVEFEYLRIVERDGSLVYIAQPGGQPPTEFRLTHMEGKAVTFENPSHDFPKVIAYKTRPDGSLEASISGAQGQRALSWVFERK